MEFAKGDIVVMDEGSERTVWLSEEAVIRELGVTEKYLWKKARPKYKAKVPDRYRRGDLMPKTGIAWRFARINKRFYYCYANIPDKAPAHYRSKLPSEPEMIAQAERTEMQTATQRAIEKLDKEVREMPQQSDIEYYMYRSMPTFANEQAVGLASVRAYFERLARWQDEKLYKQYGIKSELDLLSAVITELTKRKIYGFGIQKATSFRKKLKGMPRHIDDQRVYVINGRFGNDNARVVGVFDIVDRETGEVMKYDAHQTLMYHLYMNPFNPQKEYETVLYEKYKYHIQNIGVMPVAYRTFCFNVANFATNSLMAAQRHGRSYANKKYKPYTPFAHLEYAHSLWSGDGSGTKLQYRGYDYAGNPKIRTLYALRISDVASRCIVGYSLSPVKKEETMEMVKEAVRMAIIRGDRLSVFDFITDNHGSFTGAESDMFLRTVFDKVRHIVVGMSQQNPEEMHIRLLTESCRDQVNWSKIGFNASDIDYKANADYLPEVDKLPDYEEAVRQFAEMVRRYNDTPWGEEHLTPNQRFERKHKDCRPLCDVTLRYAFGNVSKMDVSYMRTFIIVRKKIGGANKEFMFEIPDYNNSIEMIGRANGFKSDAEVIVRWDATAADVYSAKDTYLFTCRPALKAAKSYAEATDERLKAFGVNEKRKSDYAKTEKEFLEGVLKSHEQLSYGEVLQQNKKKAKETMNAIIEVEESLELNEKQKKQIEKIDKLTEEERAFRDL